MSVVEPQLQTAWRRKCLSLGLAGMPRARRSVSFWRADTQRKPRPAAFQPPRSRWEKTAFAQWKGADRGELRKALRAYRRHGPAAPMADLVRFANEWAIDNRVRRGKT